MSSGSKRREGSDNEDSDRPRRSRRGQSVDYGEMDTEKTDADDESVLGEEANDEDLDPDEDESSEEDEKKSKKRKGQKRGKSDDEDSVPEVSRRTSSRATKFQRSMAEPDGQKEFIEKATPVKRKEKKKAKGDSLASLHLSPQKSSARRHSQHRLSINHSDEDDFQNDVSDSENSTNDSEQESLSIQRILACRTETRKKWKEICAKISSSEIDLGSRWFQSQPADETYEERFLVKWYDLSYLHCSWETEADILEQIEKGKMYIQSFLRKAEGGVLFSADERCDGDYFNPAYTQVDRILEVHLPEDSEITETTLEQEDNWKKDDFGMIFDRSKEEFDSGTGRQFLVKWGSTAYGESTFEFERDLILNDIEYKEPLKNYLRWSAKPSKKEGRSIARSREEERRKMFKVFGGSATSEKAVAKFQKELQDRVYKNGGQVRDYQAEGISWIISNYTNRRSSILADEMGLGKTLQTVASVEIMANRLTTGGTFLVIAPLSTLSHWEREFRGWSGLNVIVYHGSAEDRKTIREHEFAYESNRPKSTEVAFNARYLKKCKPKKLYPGEKPWMVQVVITTPEMLISDDFPELTCVDWETVIVDEAHRLKNHSSKLAVNLRDSRFNFNHIMLLTGTPIQNDVHEFWTLLNFIEPDGFASLDEFMEKYGNMKSKEAVDELHEEIRPYILRRLKEDVEKSVPPKEETLIEVELTVSQKKYYRALYEKNVKFLHGTKKPVDGPSLNNLAMQLRKCCNHLYLLNGVEAELRAQASSLSEADFLVRGSGKLVLLDKLLPRLKSEGHRLLVFSQFKIMLDILEDYFTAREYRYERIDGSITGNRRQQAIDRFQASDGAGKTSPFIMMLSTRAGGVGINLTAADTCIIFDSDWNPQNDLQAQARCHRIGQTKSVKVYRLLTSNTYEMQMFHMSSMKMGLDQAVLKGFESGSEASLSKAEVENLLRHGAYNIFNEEKAGTGEAESNAFVEQDLDSILQRRSRTVVHENTGSKSGAAGSTFSKASFKATSTPGKNRENVEEVDIMDPDFWKKMVGEGQDDAVEDEFATKRRRKQTNYSEAAYKKEIEATLRLGEVGNDSSSEDDDVMDSEGVLLKWGGSAPDEWRKQHFEALLRELLLFGYCSKASATAYKKFQYLEDYKEQTFRMAWATILYTALETSVEDATQNMKRDERATEKALREAVESSKPGDGGELAVVSSKTPVPLSTETEYKELSFKKLWITHKKWLREALQAAVTYSKTATANQQDDIDKATRKPPTRSADVSSQFAANVWPSLKTRGWKAVVLEYGEYAGNRCYTVGDKKFHDEESVLREARNRHPELKTAIDALITTINSAQMRTAAGQEKELQTLQSLNADSVTPELLRRLLEKFAPIQLVSDRHKVQPLRLPRKLLTTSLTMDQAMQLTKMAGAEPGNLQQVSKLASFIVMDKRSALPHPLWTEYHDAILIQAILKHGWIIQDSSCLAITNDSSVKWGAPFDAGYASAPDAVTLADWDLSDSAIRCVNFLNEFSGVMAELKGFRLNHLVKMYGLEEEEDTAGSTGASKTWCVSDATLNGISPSQSSPDEGSELPPKRELARRAKAVLTKVITDKNAASSDNKSPEDDGSYGYAILDQNSPPHSFLVGLLRVILKTPTSSKLLAKICEAAHTEAEQLHSTLVSPKTSSAPKKELISEAQRIAEQLELVKKRIGKTARQSKNLVRVMLGEKPQQPRMPSEVIFPQALSSKVGRKQGKKESKKLSSKASAERTISAAVRRINARGTQNPTTSGYLELTEVETLILMTVCAHGLPFWSDNWRGLVLGRNSGGSSFDWGVFGKKLVELADGYLKKATVKAALARDALLQLEYAPGGDGTGEEVKEAREFLNQTELVCRKSKSALEQASQYSDESDNLAKKATMLMAKVMMQMGSLKGASFTSRCDDGLGVKVLRWMDSEIGRWASSLGLIDEETMKPLAYTAVDFKDHLQPHEQTTIEVSSAFEKDQCRNLFAQTAMLSRIRSLLSTSQGDELLTRIWSAGKAVEASEGVNWDQRPDWWGDNNNTAENDYLLLQRLSHCGFRGILESTEAFGKTSEHSRTSYKHSGLSKFAIQRRANQLVRELHTLDESLKDKSGNNSLPNQAQSKKSAPGQQTGLLSFYSATSTAFPASKDDPVVIDMTEDAASAVKRKSSDTTGTDHKKHKTS